MKKAADTQEDVVVRLPLRIRRTEYGAGERVEVCTLLCPVARGSVPLERCMACERCAEVDFRPEGPPSLWCHLPKEEVPAGGAAPRELLERMERTPVAEVMTSAVTCVGSELGLEEVAQVLEEAGLRAAPVVEDDGGLVGMVSQSDLVRGRAQPQEGEPDEGRNRFPPDCLGVIVEDIMTRQVLKLREQDSLSEALKLFSSHGVHRVPVVSREDVVVGILSVMDVVRWLAKQAAAAAGQR